MKRTTQRKRAYQALQSEARRLETAERKVQEQQKLHEKRAPEDYKLVAHEYVERQQVLAAARASIRARLRGLATPPINVDVDAYLEGSEAPA